jgi:hypothetical protein
VLLAISNAYQGLNAAAIALAVKAKPTPRVAAAQPREEATGN